MNSLLNQCLGFVLGYFGPHQIQNSQLWWLLWQQQLQLQQIPISYLQQQHGLGKECITNSCYCLHYSILIFIDFHLCITSVIVNSRMCLWTKVGMESKQKITIIAYKQYTYSAQRFIHSLLNQFIDFMTRFWVENQR